MSKVFVVDTKKQPLEPVHPGHPRILLKEGRAAVYRRVPFTLMPKRAVEGAAPAPLRLKIDPGANATGLALLNDASGEVLFAAELTHRGGQITKALATRRGVRRGRRARKTRYRKARWANRRRKAGWLPPSLLLRVRNILTWVTRIKKVACVTALSQELVRFDLQQLEHIQARPRGGTDRVANLMLACKECNLAKGTQDSARNPPWACGRQSQRVLHDPDEHRQGNGCGSPLLSRAAANRWV